MSSNSKYLTLKDQSEGLYKEKGSKFIGYAVACYSEAEAKQYMKKWRDEHPQSRHLCYAYRFGVDKKKYRTNDDGEPSNSAGAPILGQLESFDLTNVLIGVIRYFGGTKLGVGGLISSYRAAARESIENGEVVEQEVYNWYKMSFDYADMPHVMNYIKNKNLRLDNKRFEESCELTFAINLDETHAIIDRLKEFNSMKLIDLGVY